MRTTLVLCAFFGVVESLLVQPSLTRLAMARTSSKRAIHMSAGTQLVWLTGAADLRVHDHGGFSAAARSGGATVACFVLNPEFHLRLQPARLARLHRALCSLEDELRDRFEMPLVVLRGDPSEVLPAAAVDCSATTCHVVADDPEMDLSAAGKALTTAGVSVQRWASGLRGGSSSWWEDASSLPGAFPEYVSAAAALPLQPTLAIPDALVAAKGPTTPSERVPSLADLEAAAAVQRAAAVREAAARPEMDTTQPYESLSLELCNERAALAALEQYMTDGRDAFADCLMGAAAASSTAASSTAASSTAASSTASSTASTPATQTSLHAAAAMRLVNGAHRPSEGLALREAPTRAFAAALTLGTLSARQVRQAAVRAGAGPSTIGRAPLWGLSSGDALADVVEWREWFTLLARRSLARQAAGGAYTSGGERGQGGDAREAGELGYWRWGGQHLVRYLHWPAGDDYDGRTPAMLLCHGFAASSEQWERLVAAMRSQAAARGEGGLPPIYAIDLLGFGHAEKPGLSYTQYVWEAQIVDFALEVMDAQPLLLMGNSIGGGLAAGASATLGPLCQGVVLCNTAGVLVEPSEYIESSQSVRDATLRGATPPYAPVPLLGQPALDAFGAAIIAGLYPRIPALLDNIYSDRPANADAALAYAIEQGASSPGAANVIGSGQKLATNRPLNEVLNARHGFGGPVLVAQGLNDRVSGPARAQERADVFERLRDGVTVQRIAGGHCPQDDSPDEVARAVLQWLPEVRAYAAAGGL